MAKSKIPTLDDLFKQLSSKGIYRVKLKEVYRLVASGERHPTKPPLPEGVVVLACQAMVVLFSHLDDH